MGTEGSTMLEPLRQGLPPTAPAGVSRSVTCALAARYESVKGARDFTKSTLGRWELNEQFDSVALVVSELVTNALRHALPFHYPNSLDPVVRLHLMCWPTHLVCAVRDPSDLRPVPGGTLDGEPDFSAESGRGLCLVEAVSDNWGWYPLAGTLRGKIVWALFDLPARTV